MLDLNLRPDRRHLRQFGYIACVALLLISAMVYWRGAVFGIPLGSAAPAVIAVASGMGLLSLVFSLLAPEANRPLYVGLTVVTYPIGWVVSHLILAFLFYGLLTPVGLVFRCLGRDPLRRKFDPRARSYWEPHRPVTDKSRYFRQF